MSAAPNRRVERLSKICGLLASPHDGERLSAAAAAEQELRALGLSWREVIERAFQLPAPPRTFVARRPAFDPPAQIAWLLSCKPLLTPWEASFAESLSRQTWPLSVRQRAKLVEVAQRVEARSDGASG